MRSLKDKPHGAIAPLTLRDLASANGLVRFSKAMNASPEDAVRVHSIAKKYIKENPNLSSLRIGKSTSGDFYDFKNNRLAVSTADPDILSHELGHANRLSDASTFYTGLLRGTKSMNSMLNKGSIPLGGSVSYSNAIDKKDKPILLKTLAAASVLSALPNLAEEVLATSNAVSNSTEKLKTLARLLPGLGSHAINDLSGAGTYLLFNRLSEKGK